MNYAGYNARTGKMFDDSFSRGHDRDLQLWRQVVPGFQKGLVGQHEGSRVLIAMPGSDGYDGDGGNPQIGVEMGDTLVFVVDIVGVPLDGPEGTKKAPKAGLPTVTDKGGTPEITIPKSDPPAELQAAAPDRGPGQEGRRETDTHHRSTTAGCAGATARCSRRPTAKPGRGPLSSLVPGVVKGLTGQTVGSRVLLVIPPAEGYPEGNATPSIAPTETLVMVVDILFAASQYGSLELAESAGRRRAARPPRRRGSSRGRRRAAAHAGQPDGRARPAAFAARSARSVTSRCRPERAERRPPGPGPGRRHPARAVAGEVGHRDVGRAAAPPGRTR